MRNALVWLYVSVIVVIVDQWSKWMVIDHLLPGDVVHWLPFFNIQLAFNSGSAFSFLSDAAGWQIPVFAAIAVTVVLILILWLARIRRNQYVLASALSLIIGGAIGNLIDRLRLSYVVDFFDFHIYGWHFATFNVADAAISVGAVLLLLSWLSEDR